MKVRQVHESVDGARTLVAVMEIGDEVMASLKELARRERLTGASLTAIGAFGEATLAYFDWDTKQYRHIPVEEQVEVATMLGDIGIDEKGEPALHVHLVLGRRDGGAVAGHLVEAKVRPTLEVVITEQPAHLRRRHDPETGLALIRLDD